MTQCWLADGTAGWQCVLCAPSGESRRDFILDYLPQSSDLSPLHSAWRAAVGVQGIWREETIRKGRGLLLVQSGDRMGYAMISWEHCVLKPYTVTTAKPEPSHPATQS